MIVTGVGRRRLAAGVLLLALVVALAGCSGGGDKRPAAKRGSPTSSPSPSASPARAGPRAVPVNPLTGLRAGRGARVLAVKVDNTANARPQVAVDQADVVYVEQVEGGVTRLLTVFATRKPDVVGPVRSARSNDIELLRPYGNVVLAFSGANAGVLGRLAAARLVPTYGDRGDPGFFRGTGRPAPYNMFVRPATVLAAHGGTATTRDVGFDFAARAPRAGRPGATGLVRYPRATISFRYDPSRRGYLVSTDGAAPQTASGAPLLATNVLVQQVVIGTDGYVDVAGNPTPYSKTVGVGEARLYRGGKAYAGTWVRRSLDAPTSWLAVGGGRLQLAPGRTWVILAPAGNL